MGSTIDDEITVERNGSQLIAFSWQGQRYQVTAVQIVGTPPTRWWEGQGERTYLRISSRGRLYEIYFDHERKTWILARRLT